MLKLLLKDPIEFDRQWHGGEKKEEEENPAFTEGTYVHALCLEPETIKANYAFYEGLRKAGENYKNFVQDNPGKIILSAPQRDRGLKLLGAYQKRPEAVSMLQGGFAEHSMVGEIMGTPVKARADYINIDKGYIVDIKTTSYPTGADVFKATLEHYNYGLSAQLYVEIAQQSYSKDFDFYFVVISKNDFCCDVYKASTKTLALGHALLIKSLRLFQDCKATGVWSLTTKREAYESQYEILEV
jgi:hypothetical protein